MIYIHVPFCKTRCVYCDFYSTTFLAQKDKYVQALCNEIRERSHYLDISQLETIYFGGGTPSLLNIADLEKIFDGILELFTLAPDAEITIEANPDDITPNYVKELSQLPINRISLGVQTFNDRLLKFLNRRHTARQVDKAVTLLNENSLHNISIDLIYGLPGQSLPDWEKDLMKAFSLPIAHLSAYSLIFEESTLLGKMKAQGTVRETDEETSLEMFMKLMETASENGFEHYEISNFALPEKHSRHNSGYWKDKPYLGLGPGAHSFNGTTRRWNSANLEAYIQSNGRTDSLHLYEEEFLTEDMLHNETIMKRLRTSEGLHLEAFANRFGNTALQELLRNAAPYIETGELLMCDYHKKIRLSRSGIFVSDGIMSSLFRC